MDKALKVEVKQLPQLRLNTNLLLLQDPGYFGKIVTLGDYQTHYEQLECIGYSPETQTLGAIVNIKQPTGYDGSPCVGGSREYVRFYLDYNHTGVWVDSGITNFGIYDHPFTDTLSYYASVPLDPALLSCCQAAAVLPKVRAILSWNVPPPPNTPGYHGAWGNVLEAEIQLAPEKSIWCYIKQEVAPQYLKALSDIEVNIPTPVLTPVELKAAYGNAVPESRIALNAVLSLAKAPFAVNPALLANVLPGFDIAKIIPVYAKPEYDVQWEALGCVGLDRDLSQLNATVIIKQDVGYNGGLCTAGSREFVAFYMDFGSGWEYMGTSSAAVHDIPRTGQAPLAYDVALTVNLDAYRPAWCTVGKAKVLAILSWNVAPTPNDPAFKAIYGNTATAEVELQPLPAGVIPGEVVPFIEMVGGMVVTDIDLVSGLATTTAWSSSIIGGAVQSPFFGSVRITGKIFNAPPGTQYRLLIQTPPPSTLNPLMNSQTVQTDTLGVISSPILLTPSAPDSTSNGGWMPYLATSSDVSIVDNLLGIYNTPSGADGIYIVGIDLMDTSGNVTPGNRVKFRVNSEFQMPAIDITTGAGDCSSSQIGSPISGTFSMTNTEYASSLELSVTPNNGAIVTILSNPASAAGTDSLYYPFTLSTEGAPILPGDSGSTGYFTIDTSKMTVCGYNINIGTWDRTIINSIQLGYYAEALQGFCLIK
jgi:hypothetical protein